MASASNIELIANFSIRPAARSPLNSVRRSLNILWNDPVRSFELIGIPKWLDEEEFGDYAEFAALAAYARNRPGYWKRERH